MADRRDSSKADAHNSEQGEDGTSPASTAATIRGTDRYTMAEAARLKGVSYHTVSRAVRRGRLPVERLGRMVLIAADDLQAWNPMRERAPRKYRRREPSSDVAPVLLDLASGTRVELAERLSTLYEVIHGASVELPAPEFAALVADRVAEAFDLDRVTIWAADLERRIAYRIAQHGGALTKLPDVVPLDEGGYFSEFMQRGRARLIVDLVGEAPEFKDLLYTEGIGTVFSAPLRVGGRPVGAIYGDRNGETFEFTSEQLSLLSGLANQTALAVEHAQLREAATQQTSVITAVFNELSDAVRSCDKDGFITLSNAVDRRMLNLAPGESPIGMHISELLGRMTRFDNEGVAMGPEDTAMFVALQGKHVDDDEYNVVYADGTTRNIAAMARPLMEGDEVTGAVLVLKDITEAREADLSIQGNLRQLQDAARRAEVVTESVTRVHAAMDIASAAQVTMELIVDELGGTASVVLLRDGEGRFVIPRQVAGNPPLALGGPYDPVALPSLVVAFARNRAITVRRGDVARAELELLDDLRAERALVVPIQVGDEQFGAVLVALPAQGNVSAEAMAFATTVGQSCAHAIQRLRLIDELESAHQRLLAVIDQAPQAVLILSHPNADVLIANKAADDLWGQDIEATSLRAHDLAMVDEDSNRYAVDRHPLLRSLHSGEESLGEPQTVQQDDGTLVPVLTNQAAITDGRGAVIGSVVTLQARADLKPLDRTRDEFLSFVAHELRNPITSLRGNLQLLQRRIQRSGDVDVDDATERMESIIGQTDRVSDLVGRMLDVSRAGLGRLDISVEPTDAMGIVNLVIEEAAGLLLERSVNHTGPETLPVVWDAVRIEQILTNLMGNAARYAPGGAIDVTTEVDAGWVTIAVRDYGPGVPASIKRRLFTQYYRFDDGSQETSTHRHDEQHGLGVGLYISARLARAHGGDLTVEDAEGGGAVFTLHLPVDAS